MRYDAGALAGSLGGYSEVLAVGYLSGAGNGM